MTMNSIQRANELAQAGEAMLAKVVVRPCIVLIDCHQKQTACNENLDSPTTCKNKSLNQTLNK
jgi:hypothetical protein